MVCLCLMAALVLPVTAAAGASAVTTAATMSTMAPDAVSAPQTSPAAPSLRVGHSELPPGPGQRDAVLQAVQKTNQANRLAGLPPEFDIGLLDPDKVRAFIDGLGQLPLAQRERLAGTVLQLDAAGLGLASSSALRAETLAKGYQLQWSPARPPGAAPVALRIDAPRDAQLARQRIAEAQHRLAAVEQQVATAQREVAQARSSNTLVRLAQHQQEAISLAMVWRDLLDDLPDTKSAEREAAAAAVTRLNVVAPARGGMP